MDTSTIVMLVAAVITLMVVHWQSPEAAGKGLGAAGALILEITPRMLAAFTIAGLIQAVVPQEVIVKWMARLGHEGYSDWHDPGHRDSGRPHDAFPDRRIVVQSGRRHRPAGFLSDRVVSFRAPAHHHVGDPVSRAQGGCDPSRG